MTSAASSALRLFICVASALALVLTVGIAGRAPEARGAVAKAPPTPSGLPAAIEAPASYVPNVSCRPAARTGTLKLARLLKATYPSSSYGTGRACGSVPNSEHYDGRAIDWMVSVRNPTQAAQANATIKWLLATDRAGNKAAMARRLGVMYIIWNNRIWSAYRSSGGGWREYSNCTKRPARALDSTCHRNHVHFSLSWEGALGKTSYWTKRVARAEYGPCRSRDLNWAYAYGGVNRTRCAYYPRVSPPRGASATLKALTTYSGLPLRRGSSGPAVRAVQRAVKVTSSGSYGSQTEAAVKRFQRSKKITATGKVNKTTWRALLKANAPR